jgi:hypothetical protein
VIFTRSDGVQVDMTTGQVVGQVQPRQVSMAEARLPETGGDVYPASAGRTALDALGQVSAGLNTVFFGLGPDQLVKAAKALNVIPEEVPTFTQYFNRGREAPKNAVERVANAIGQGMAGTIPATGLLGYFARTKALTTPLTPGAPITKQIAKETLDFVRQNPGKAIALDQTFGAIYGGTEQLVKEVTEPGMARDILSATAPIGVTLAIPATGSKLFGLAKRLTEMSPTMGVARAVATPSPKVPGTEGFDFYHPAVAETIPNIPGIRGPVGFMGNYYGSRAQRTISKQLQDVLAKEGGLEAQEAIALTDAIENIAKREGFEDARFVFSLPEATLIPTLRQTFDEIMRSASPAVRADINARMDENVRSFLNVAQKFKPSAPMSMGEALVLHDAQKTKSIKDALDQIEGLRADEAANILERYRLDTNLADIGSTLRSSILAMRDGTMFKFRDMVDQFTMRPEGVRAPVRKEGQPIEGVPTVDFDGFAKRMLAKYKMTPDNRLFGGEVPGPAKEIQKSLGIFEKAKEKAVADNLEKIIREEFKDIRAFTAQSPEAQEAEVKRSVRKILTGEQDRNANIWVRLIAEKEEPILLRKAQEAAEKSAGSQITLPEAMDLLLAAQRYRTHMFVKSQNDLQFGMPRAFADQVDRSGRELLGDVENFVFTSFKNAPGIGALESAYRDMFTKGFDKLFPLMATRKRPTGEFEIGDQRLVEEALKNRDNLRSLNVIFGDNHPTYAKNLEVAVLAKARQAGVIDKDGLINPQAYNRFISGLSRSGVMDDLPPSVQATLRNEAKTGQAFADEIAKQKAAVEAMEDRELDTLIKKSIRPDADTGQLVRQAVEDPAVMRKLVNTVGKDEAKLQAMRREFWEGIVARLRDEADPQFLNDYLTRYGKSLNMLYTPEHMNNLKLLGAIQERVFAVSRPAGALSPFRTFDVKLREKIGAGVGTIESTARAAMIRQISPQHAVVSLLSRFFTRQQQSITDKILLSALTDPAYAARLVEASAPITTPKGFNQVSKLTMQVGGYLPSLLRNSPRIASIEAIQAMEDEEMTRPAAIVPPEMISPVEQRPTPAAAARPAVPRMPEPTFLQQYQRSIRPENVVPAPSMNLPQSRLLQSIPPGQAPQQLSGQQYQALFPNDPLSTLIQQRRP